VLASPSVDDAGMLWLDLSESTVAMDDPEITLGSADLWLLEFVTEAALDWVVEPLAEALFDVALESFGSIPLGGPYTFGTDLMGRSLDVALIDVYSQTSGLGAELDVALEDFPSQPVTLPAPVVTNASADVGVGLHEGLLDEMFRGLLTEALTQEIVLPGSFGELIGTGVRALPGGETVPAGEGWCLSLSPQPAQVVRLAPGLEPLAQVYMPDLFVDIGIQQGGVCVPWLQASVAAKVGLEVEEGTKIGPDVEFVEGALLYYGATTAWKEEEVVDGLLTFLGGAAVLFGGMVEIDLAEMLVGTMDNGAFGEITPRIVSSEPLVDAQSGWVEGAYAIGIQLWPDEGGS
jgi:hypothetical protein